MNFRAIMRSEVVCYGGLVVGALIAAIGATESRHADSARLPSNAVATVNDRLILREDYQRALEAVQADRHERITSALQKHALERLIDEELLVQRGIELGLAERDRRIRAGLVAAIIDLIVIRAEEAAMDPGDEELQNFYRAEFWRFRSADFVHVEQIFVRGDNANQRAVELWTQLDRGGDFAHLKLVADPPPASLPDGLIPITKLADYVGAAAYRAVSPLSAGEITEPIELQNGYRIIRVVDRKLGQVPPFEEIRSVVAAEFRRHAGDRALRQFLSDRRIRSQITISPELQ